MPGKIQQPKRILESITLYISNTHFSQLGNASANHHFSTTPALSLRLRITTPACDYHLFVEPVTSTRVFIYRHPIRQISKEPMNPGKRIGLRYLPGFMGSLKIIKKHSKGQDAWFEGKKHCLTHFTENRCHRTVFIDKFGISYYTLSRS